MRVERVVLGHAGDNVNTWQLVVDAEQALALHRLLDEARPRTAVEAIAALELNEHVRNATEAHA